MVWSLIRSGLFIPVVSPQGWSFIRVISPQGSSFIRGGLSSQGWFFFLLGMVLSGLVFYQGWSLILDGLPLGMVSHQSWSFIRSGLSSGLVFY